MLKKWTAVLAACAALLSAGPAAAEKYDFDQGVDVKPIVERIQAFVARSSRITRDAIVRKRIFFFFKAPYQSR